MDLDIKLPLYQKMNTAFTQLSRSNIQGHNNQKPTAGKDDFSKVRVNVVGNWSKKRGPSISFSVQPSPPKKRRVDPQPEDLLEKPRRLKSFNIYLTEDDNVQSVNEYNDTLPDKVEGTYKYDFNIVDIHDLILKRFDRRKQHDVKRLQEELHSEDEKMKGRQNMVERKASIRITDRLKETLDNILSGKDFNSYLYKIKPLVDQYNLIGTLSKIVSFATNKKKVEEEEEELPEDPNTQLKRHQVIFDFLEIARKYIQIDLIREVKEGNICSSCGFKLEDVNSDADDSGIIVCSNCGIERIAVVRSRFYKDNTRTNNSGNNYEDRANFEKVVMRFQGKQPDKPPLDLYIVLENHFREKELPRIDIHDNGIPIYVSSDYIKNHISLNNDGEKDGTSRSLMYKALKDTGNSNYYDHINLILHEMWDWELPDVSYLEDMIMDDYDKSQRIYEVLPKDRKSSLNSQFRLFKHLRRLGYPCKARNFRIPTTHDILEFHENIWAKICEILGWENL